jgi:hypothetical protein
MCEKCSELDKAIERYHRVIRSILDPVTVSEAKKLLAEVLQQGLLHPEDGPSRRKTLIGPHRSSCRCGHPAQLARTASAAAGSALMR